jgi:hypothetical protein
VVGNVHDDHPGCSAILRSDGLGRTRSVGPVTVISWYSDKLKALGMEVRPDIRDDAHGVLWSNGKQNDRSLNINTERAGSKNVIAIDLMDNPR